MFQQNVGGGKQNPVPDNPSSKARADVAEERHDFNCKTSTDLLLRAARTQRCAGESRLLRARRSLRNMALKNL